MPAINFNKDFSSLERTILTKTFGTNCLDLGISEKPFRVHVSKPDLGNPKLYARVANPNKNVFLLEMNRNAFNLYDAVASLGHETIHIKQHLMGELTDTEDAVHWKNSQFPRFLVPFLGNDVPWEYEAWDRMENLRVHAVAGLDEHERKLIDPNQSNGLNMLLDPDYHPWRK